MTMNHHDRMTPANDLDNESFNQDNDDYDAEKGPAEDDGRDEIKELKRLSRKENNLVLTGKVMMGIGLLITVAVSFVGGVDE
jgi:hypothetical protein